MKLIVISNRVRTTTDDADGCALALEELLKERGGVWLGWSGETAAMRSASPDLTRRGNFLEASVALTREDVRNHHDGYAGSVLWPLCHERLQGVSFREDFRTAYLRVNGYLAAQARRFIEDDDLVWVHGHQLIPLAGQLRQLGVRTRIGLFLPLPFPPFDVLRALPQHEALLESLFAYELLGVQTATDLYHLGESLVRGLGARLTDDGRVAHHEGRRVRLDVFPMGTDVSAVQKLARRQHNTPERQALVESLTGRPLIVGADPLDPASGLLHRLRAFECLLERHGSPAPMVPAYLQLITPSRATTGHDDALAAPLEAMAGRINARHGSLSWMPLRLLERPLPRPVLLGCFAAADVGLVTPLRDGMSLVAKEFLAAQPESDPGVLVLSALTGAAEELAEAALIVNPYDANLVAEAIHRALNLSTATRRGLWQRGMTVLERNRSALWRDRFLNTLAWGSTAAASPRMAPVPQRHAARAPRPVGAHEFSINGRSNGRSQTPMA